MTPPNRSDPLRRMGLAVTLPELEQCADWLKEGARDVELQDICELPELLDGDWRTQARKSLRLLDGHTGRVGVHAPFWNLSVVAIDPAIRKVVQSRYLLGLDYAEEVGGTHLVIHSPFFYFGHSMVVHQDTLPQELAIAHDTLAPVLERAATLNCTLVIENILDVNPLPLRTLVASFGSPHVRMSIDVGHAHIQVGRGAPPAAHWLHAAGELLGHVHLQDNDGASDAHLAPGGGTVHWESVLRELRAFSTDPRLIVEVVPGEVRRAMAWVDSLEAASMAYE
ncbi:sugar phosphate isomerase/epimerase family protein [Deinococcus ruber]|uniref:Sugar phosphate isomerase n=1 Tax=Deinococcus ruber TaxID=1848197 RepID=A0A918C656_9DEIO|nr:TIM barrel protein [Deinococcus ruber]GGR07184.1 sugar phosphate isomerase [Deinococcus ruber]